MIGILGRNEKEMDELLSIDIGVSLLDDINVDDKVVIVRADLNLPIEGNKVHDTTRLDLFAKTTLKELIEKNARIVVLTHQGRKGKPDYTNTKIHADLLSERTGKYFEYIPSLYGNEAEEALIKLRKGINNYIILENTRFYDEETAKVPMEEHAKSKMVSLLSRYADYYINDAFASSHRNHASLVGFPFMLPSVAGRIMEWELRSIEYINQKDNDRTLYILGGAKVPESLEVIETILSQNKAMKVALGGLVANAFAGFGEGEDVKKAVSLKKKFGEKIYVPEDFVVDGKTYKREELTSPPKDIGEKSIEKIKSFIDEAKQVFINGPLGYFEEEQYLKASREIFSYLGNSSAFTVAGGGHTITCLNRLNLFDKIDHVSTGGRALLNAIMGKPLPAVEALKEGIRP